MAVGVRRDRVCGRLRAVLHGRRVNDQNVTMSCPEGRACAVGAPWAPDLRSPPQIDRNPRRFGCSSAGLANPSDAAWLAEPKPS